MSDKTQPTPPPSPAQKTAAVPLKKETVRITLRARPGAGLTQPKELTAPVQPPSITSPVPRPITTSVTPAGAASTGRVPTAPAPMSPVALAKTGSVTPISKATAPIQLPSAPLPPPAARPATAPVQLPPGAPAAARTTTYVKLDSVPPPAGPSGPPRPGAPPPSLSPTVPLAKAPGPPRPPGAAPAAPRPGGGAAPMAPTVPLAKAPGPPRPPGAKVEAGASTVPLTKAPSVVPKPPGAGTSPVAKTGGPTQSLPKATVQLAKSPGTQPIVKAGAPPPAAAAAKRGDESAVLEDERDPEAGLAPLAVLCTLMAVALMGINLLSTDRWFSADPTEDSAFMVPTAPHVDWEKDDGEGNFTSTFNTKLKEITKNFE